MALPDISTLTDEELMQLFQAANNLYQQRQAEQAADDETRRQQIYAAIADLDTLLGPVGAPKGTGNIRGILQYTDAEMAANAGIAFRRTFQGLERLALTMLDVAHVVSKP